MRITYAGGTRFDIRSGRHTIVADQPAGDGGSDAGMSPVELFVGSLASCIGYFVARYGARHAIPIAGFTIDADWTFAEQPHRVGAVRLRLRLPASLSDSQKERLLAVAHGCTVHRSLEVPPQVKIVVGESQEDGPPVT
jgi:uncharacterized OsmC-like protein